MVVKALNPAGVRLSSSAKQSLAVTGKEGTHLEL